jgi:hypothetical protein
MTSPDLNAKVEPTPSPSAILLVFLFYVAGTGCNWGFLSWWGLPLVLTAAVLAFWFHARPRCDGPPPEALLTGIFIACVVAACWLKTGQDQLQVTGEGDTALRRTLASERLTGCGVAIKLSAVAALILGTSYFSRSAARIGRWRFWALILIAVVMRLNIMFSTPAPRIDVFDIQTAAGKGLLNGKNAYQMHFLRPYYVLYTIEIVRNGAKETIKGGLSELSGAAPGATADGVVEEDLTDVAPPHLGYSLDSNQKVTKVVPFSPAATLGIKVGDVIEKVAGRPDEFTHFAYPPEVVCCNCISWELFGDVRAVWAIFDVLAALMMYFVARRFNPGAEGARLCELLPLTFLFLPRSVFVIEQSWTEPLVAVTMGAFVLAVASGRGSMLTGALLGLWLGSKQYVVLAIPAVLKLRRLRPLAWVYAIAMGLALLLPFAIWDFHAMMESILYFFLKSDARGDALSLYGLAVLLGISPSAGWISVAVAILWIAGIAWFARKMPRNLSGMLFATAGTWIFFFALGKQAFANYGYLVAFTLLLAVAATPATETVGRPATRTKGKPTLQTAARSGPADEA